MLVRKLWHWDIPASASRPASLPYPFQLPLIPDMQAAWEKESNVRTCSQPFPRSPPTGLRPGKPWKLIFQARSPALPTHRSLSVASIFTWLPPVRSPPPLSLSHALSSSIHRISLLFLSFAATSLLAIATDSNQAFIQNPRGKKGAKSRSMEVWEICDSRHRFVAARCSSERRAKNHSCWFHAVPNANTLVDREFRVW